MKRARKTMDVTHTGPGGPVKVSVNAESPAKAAAGIVARRMYGRRGSCRILRLDSWAPDYSSSTYEAFVGMPAVGGGMVGKNIWIYV